jgi:hypothetical protein
MNTGPGTGDEPAVTPIDAAPPERVIEQLQRLADRAIRRRSRGCHLIARMHPAQAAVAGRLAGLG